MTGDLRIEQRSSSHEIETFDDTFASLPHLLAERERRTMSPPPALLWKQLLRYGETRHCEFWLAYSSTSGAPIARIGADLPRGRKGESSIGFFECAADTEALRAGAQLLECAQKWLASNAAQTVYGPMDFNSWFSYRFKIRNADRPENADKAWEPAAPEFYRQLFLNNGFTEDLQFASFSYEIPSTEHWQAYMKTLQKEYEAITQQRGYTIRPFLAGEEFLQDLRRIFELSNIAFADNPMFEKIPFEIFSALTISTTRSANSEASRLVLSPHGDTVGFAFCFVEKDELIYKTVAVHPEHRSMGIANSLTYEISSYCLENSILKTTGALVRSGNTSEKIGRRYETFTQPAKVNQYSLLRKTLS